MKWYWILLIVITYLPIGGILEGLLERWNILEGDEGLAINTVLLWPLMFPFCLLTTVAERLSQWVSGSTDDDDDEHREEQEPVSEDLETAAIDYIAGAQWQKEQMMKGAIEGQVERGYCEDGISEHFEVFACLSGRDERFKDLSDGQSVKVIIIKE